jgi:hypothetical protein
VHSSRELRSSSFEIAVRGSRVRLEELFAGFGEHDRLGVVLRSPCGAVGASALITATITAFYDIQRARGPRFFIYPEYYLFHAGRPLGDHARLDIWPPRKEVVVGAEAGAILEAINERAVTRLVVEDGRRGPLGPEGGEPGRAGGDAGSGGGAPALARGGPAFAREELASARSRIATCLAYSPAGRVVDGDVRITSNPVTEGYVQAILDPEGRIARLRAGGGADRARADALAARAGEVAPEVRARMRRARAELEEGGTAVETYRRITLDEALGLLG